MFYSDAHRTHLSSPATIKGEPRAAANRRGMGNSAPDAYRVTTTLSQEQRRELENLAKKHDVKVAWIIRRAVERLIAQMEADPMLPLDFKP